VVNAEAGVEDRPWRRSFRGVNTVGHLAVIDGNDDLRQVIAALAAAGGLAGELDRREQESDQHADDGHDHQQLDQRETSVPPRP
jgi:hypothetical protein